MPPLTISVIIPCYNGLPYVCEAIQSVLVQANKHVECVAVDDGSTDGSASVIQNDFGRRVRVIRQANAGAAAARNRGIAETTGDLILWLDADDRLLPETISLRCRAFEEDPALEMLVGVTEFVNTATGFRYLTPKTCGPDYLASGLLRRGNCPRQMPWHFAGRPWSAWAGSTRR